MFLDETVELTDAYVISKKFKTPVEFNMHIDNIVNQKNISYMDAVLVYCEQENIDPESVAPLITQKLKEKIRVEAEENNLINVTGKLLID